MQKPEEKKDAPDSESHTPDVSVVLPCLNEEKTVGVCVSKALNALAEMGVEGEVIVVDNGSTDNSPNAAKAAGARLVVERERGYGNALKRGFAVAQGRFVIMADADDSYDLVELPALVDALRQGSDVVIGSRFRGRIHPGAMPFAHRYLGTPILSGLLRLMYGTNISDSQSGMRGFRRDALQQLRLSASGMELASEIILKAAKAGLKITEVPISLHPGAPGRQPHLRSFRDGWRHLKLIFISSPRHLFLLPGVSAFVVGWLMVILLLPGQLRIGRARFDIHWSVLGSLLAILGFQLISFHLFARVYSVTYLFSEPDRLVEFLMRRFRLEHGLVAGLAMALAGFAIDLLITIYWVSSGFGLLWAGPAIAASTLMVVGVQTVFSSFLLSLLSTSGQVMQTYIEQLADDRDESAPDK